MAAKALLALAAAQVAVAHFGLDSPEWRGDTLDESEDSTYNQWVYPCANVPYGDGNTTDWNGKSVTLELHHPWSLVWLNVGLGKNTSDFNITLTPQFYNVTSNGTVCIDDLPFPDDVADGTEGTLQVVTSDKGSALYNCADFKFKKDAKSSGKCEVPEGIEVLKVKSTSEQDEHDHDEKEGSDKEDGDGKDGADSEESGDDDSAAGMLSLSKVTLSALVAVGFGATMLGL